MFNINVKTNIFDKHVEKFTFPYIPNFTIWEYLTSDGNTQFDLFFKTLTNEKQNLVKTEAIKFLFNLEIIDPVEGITKIIPKDGDTLTIIISPKWSFVASILIGLLISLASTYVSYLLSKPPSPPATANESEIIDSSTYNWDGPATSYALGRPVPIIYGDHATGGSFINAMVEGLPYGHGEGWSKGDSIGRPNSFPRKKTGKNKFSNWDSFKAWTLAGMGGWWDSLDGSHKIPTGRGAYLSNLFTEVTAYENPNYMDAALTVSSETVIDPIWLRGINGNCEGNQNLPDEHPDNDAERYQGTWMVAYKELMRIHTFDPDSGLVTMIDNWNVLIKKKDPLYINNPTWEGFHAHFLDGKKHPLPASEVTEDMKTGAFAAAFPNTAADLAVGDRIYIELYIEALLYSTGDDVDYLVFSWVGCQPRIHSLSYHSYGLVDKSEADLDKTYSTSDGLRMLLGVSEGEVCSIANLDTTGVTRDYYKNYQLTINDTPADKLFEFPDVAGFVSPLEIQASRGANHTIIKFPQGQDSYVNLFNKRELNVTQFDYLIETAIRPHFIFPSVSVCNELDLTLDFPKGLYTYDGNEGEFSERKVLFFIKYYPTSNEDDFKYWTHEGEKAAGYKFTDAKTKKEVLPEELVHVPFILKDYRTNPFKLVIRLGAAEQEQLPSNQYTVEIWRHTQGLEGDTGDAGEQGFYYYDMMSVKRIGEYGFEMLRYPNTAVLGLRLLPTEKLSGAAPKINFQVEGKYIKVPILRRPDATVAPLQNAYTEYDSDTGVYTWKELTDRFPQDTDTTLTTNYEEYMFQYNNNPAFILYDLLTTQDLYPYFQESYLTWSNFVDAGAFCWEMVNTDFVDVKQERRFECNIVLDGSTDAATILNQITTMFRLKLLWVGDKLLLKVLQPELPSQKFTDASMLPKSYQESYQSFGKVPNTLDISFYDETNYYKQSVIQVSTKDSEVGKNKILKQAYSVLGTTKLSQALRIAQYLLAFGQLTDKTIQFKTTLTGLASLPGDVVRIQSSAMSYGYSGFLRLAPDLATDTYYLDKELYIPLSKCGDYRFEVQKRLTKEYGQAMVNFSDGGAPHTFSSLTSVTLLTPNGDPITVSESDEWQLSPSSAGTVYTKDVRITNITTDVEKGECTITAEPYLPNIYTEDPLTYTIPYVPAPPPPATGLPPDVADLSLTKIEETYNIKVSYAIPTGSTLTYFTGNVESFITTTGEYVTLYYGTTPNDSQLTPLYPIKIISVDGTEKGIVDVVDFDIEDNYIRISHDTEITIEVGDLLVQEKLVAAFLSVDHTNIFFSENGTSFNLHGQDYSKGAGYIINLSSSYIGRTVWVKVQAVGIYGALSPNPPTVSIRLSADRCLPSPSHLSMCSVGDGQATFTGCDVCVSWSEVSSFQGAGLGEDSIAGDRADITGDFRITGHTIWIYNNADPDAPLLLRSLTGYRNIEYEYNHNMNREDQYRYSGVESSGYRDLKFEVYQEDAFGNVSCSPAVIELSNGAPSMSGYTPWSTGGDLSMTIDWSGFINDPSQMPEDVEGYEVIYGLSLSSMTVLDIPDPTQGIVILSGLATGTYTVYVVPYDCFGTGLPKLTYASNPVYPIVSGTSLPTYVPSNPEGMASGLTIVGDAVDNGTHYLIICEDSLQSFGFDQSITSEGAYAASTFTTNYVYYNSEPGDDYCYVTASDLNNQNLISAIWWNTGTSKWNIRVPKPSSTILTSYGYTAGQGQPKDGQKFSINVWAELTYEEGGGVWGGGLGSTLHMNWFAPNLSSSVDRLSHFSFNITNNDSGSVAKEHSVGVDKELADDAYYAADVENLPPANSLSLSAVLWSNSGDYSTSLTVGEIYVIVEVLSDSPPVTATFTAVADEEGRNIQFSINNWENIWDEARVKHFEFFVHPGHYTFSTETWSAPTVFETDFIAGTYEAKPYEEEEFDTEESRDKLRAKIDGSYLHVFAGASDAPVWQWTNETCTDDGGVCVYSVGGTCTNGYASVYGTLNCPNGEAYGGCTYLYTAGDCSRVVDTIAYNTYYVAVAVRHRTGMLQFLTYTEPNGTPTSDYVHEATLDLINWMHISNAAITTAKIGDLAVSNAKVRNLAAQKVWIGDSASTSAQPFTGNCVYDKGNGCAYYGCAEGAVGCRYHTFNSATNVGCPTAQAYPLGCPYTPQEFAISRIFDVYGTDPSGTREYTYINGGMLMTNSIKAKSIQIGALSYVLDLEAHQKFSNTKLMDNEITIEWHKGGEPGTHGYVSFVDGTGYYIYPSSITFTKASGAMPSGVAGNITTMWTAYLFYLTLTNGQTAYINWTPDPITDMQAEGKLPLFTVVMTNDPAGIKGESFIGGIGANPSAITMLNSSTGQLSVQIVWATPTDGTYIRNNDITTGVIRNPSWTSFLDMRHYSSFDSAHLYKGHGRLVIDGPSALHDRSVSTQFGDNLGRQWWNYVGTTIPDSYGSDTKLLIGRPYVDRLETYYPYTTYPYYGNRKALEADCDSGYMWFYRTYDAGASKWVGNLEIGGTLRVKDITNYRDLLVGQEYVANGIRWDRQSAPGLYIYDTTALLNNLYPNNEPVKLVQLGGETLVDALEADVCGHYFNNDRANAKYTVCIDHDSQAPVNDFYDEDAGVAWAGWASLLIIPALPGNYSTTGILIRSGVSSSTNWAPGTGLRIVGNFMSAAIHAELIRSGPIGPDTCAAIKGTLDHTVTGGGNVLKGADFRVITGTGVQHVVGVYSSIILGNGIVNDGYGVDISIDVGDVSSSYWGNCAGLRIDCNKNWTGSNTYYVAHIRFVDLVPASTRPNESIGQVGDLIAGENNIWYRAANTDILGRHWKTLGNA